MKIKRINSDRSLDIDIQSAIDIESNSKRYRIQESKDGSVELLSLDGQMEIFTVSNNVIEIDTQE